MKKDIDSLKDVQSLVDIFYARVQKDVLLGPIFNAVLSGRWEMHHRKLYRFWHTVLLRRPDYFDNPVPLHFSLNLNDDQFEGKIAERAKFRGKTMADSFLSHIKKAAGR